MRSIQPYRRRSSTSFWLGLLMILLMAAGGVVGLLLFLGVNLNPFATPREDPFMVRIPINSQPIPAYARVVREHLLNPATGGIMFQRVPPQSTVGMSITGITADGSHVESRIESVRYVRDQVVFVVSDGREVPHGQAIELGGAIMNVNAIIGRVVKKDKRIGMGFQENTFFPHGTPEGIAGATPPGMRAITLDATKLTGVHALNAGDTIDLMASVPVGELGSFHSHYNSRLPGAALVASTSSNDSEAATEPMLLAQGAVVIKPVYVRNEASTTSSLTQGKRVQNEPKYEVAIAVAPDDVIPLQNALNKSLTITCIAHSMQAGVQTPVATTPSALQSELLAPVTIRPIPAYEVVTREAFVSSATRRVRMEPVSRQQADRLGIILSLDDALGAVARHDISAGSFLRSRDLLNHALPETPPVDRTLETRKTAATAGPFQFVSQPHEPSEDHADDSQPSASVVGDRPAITSFIPAGRVAIAVPWNLLYGAEHLQIDDRVDIVASYSLERKQSTRKTEKQSDGAVVETEFDEYVHRTTDRTIAESVGLRGEPWLIATDAIVIGPVGFPAPSAALRAIGNARPAAQTSETHLSGPAILLAVDSRDVESLTAALNTKDALFSSAYRPQHAEATPFGYKRIAVAPVELPACELFSDLNWKGLRREITTRLVREDDANFLNAIEATEIADFYGRVLKSAKLRFEHFTADDFLPAGVKPGVAAGIADGALAIAVSTSQIAGLGLLEDDDRVAILLTGDSQLPSNSVLHGTGGLGPAAKVVVQQARIVRSASDASDVVTLEVPIPDAAALSAVLGSQASSGQLLAVALARQAQANAARDVAASREIPDHLPINQAQKIQAIVGRSSELHLFQTEREERP